MKVLVVLSVVVAAALAKPSGLIAPFAYAAAPVVYAAAPVEVSSQYHAQDELGQYSYGYSSGLSSKTEVKTLDGVTRGGYSYVDAEGKLQFVEYASDPVHGFRVAASNLPVAPVVPTLVGPAPVQDTAEVVEAKARHLAALKEAEARAAAAPAEEGEVVNAPEGAPVPAPAPAPKPAPIPSPAPEPSPAPAPIQTAAPASTLPVAALTPIAPLPAPSTIIAPGTVAAPALIPAGPAAPALTYSYSYAAPSPITYSTYATHVATAPIVSYAPAAYASYAAPITYTTHLTGAPIHQVAGPGPAVEAKVAQVEPAKEKKD